MANEPCVIVFYPVHVSRRKHPPSLCHGSIRDNLLQRCKEDLARYLELRTLPSLVTAAKTVEECGDHATSPTALPRSKVSTACSAQGRELNGMLEAFERLLCNIFHCRGLTP